MVARPASFGGMIVPTTTDADEAAALAFEGAEDVRLRRRDARCHAERNVPKGLARLDAETTVFVLADPARTEAGANGLVEEPR